MLDVAKKANTKEEIITQLNKEFDFLAEKNGELFDSIENEQYALCGLLTDIREDKDELKEIVQEIKEMKANNLELRKILYE